MAVSKNKRKGESDKKRKQRLARVKREQKRKEEKQVSKLLDDGIHYFNESYQGTKEIVTQVENLIQIYNGSEWVNNVDDSTKANCDDIVNRTAEVVREAKENMSEVWEKQQQIQKQIEDNTISKPDANMEIMMNTYGLNDHAEYLATKAVDDLSNALTIKTGENEND